MTFQMNRAAASIYLLIKLHAAFFAETPAFHMFFKSVFHYHPASINESVGDTEHRWSGYANTSYDLQEADVAHLVASPSS